MQLTKRLPPRWREPLVGVTKGNNLPFSNGRYDLLFEVCFGIPDESVSEEVYYKFTFIRDENPIFKVLKDDDYGWNSETIMNTENGNLDNVNPVE